MTIDDPEDERKAMEWLKVMWDAHPAGPEPNYPGTLLRMLARPVLPETHEIGESAFVAMFHAAHKYGAGLSAAGMREAYRALHAHLTAPKTKEIEVWRVEWAEQVNCYPPPDSWEARCRAFRDRAQARKFAEDHDAWYCIRVTGPHKQTVPA